jgi:regulator of replication initiation timing
MYPNHPMKKKAIENAKKCRELMHENKALRKENERLKEIAKYLFQTSVGYLPQKDRHLLGYP